MTFTKGQRVTVAGEAAVIIEPHHASGWPIVSFPGRDRFKSGHVDPAKIVPVAHGQGA